MRARLAALPNVQAERRRTLAADVIDKAVMAAFRATAPEPTRTAAHAEVLRGLARSLANVLMPVFNAIQSRTRARSKRASGILPPPDRHPLHRSLGTRSVRWACLPSGCAARSTLSYASLPQHRPASFGAGCLPCAIRIDATSANLSPCFWRPLQLSPSNQRYARKRPLEQVWFAGAHSNVAAATRNRACQRPRCIWMLRKRRQQLVFYSEESNVPGAPPT